MDHIRQFSAAISAAGLHPPEAIIDDGEIHRFSTNGKRGDKAGWYVLYGDGVPAGQFGDFRSGLESTFRAEVGRQLTHDELHRHRERIEETRRKREAELAAEREAARTTALEMWERAGPPNGHLYLKRKQAQPYKIRELEGMLLVPVYDAAGKMVGMQRIYPNGDKFFLRGTPAAGGYMSIGRDINRIVICEGWATGASIHEATGRTAVVAFNAGNLVNVAKIIRGKYPKAEIVIAADNDQFTDGNPGVTAAREAGQAINARVVIPLFEDVTDRPTDFNDMHCTLGLDAVRAAFDQPGQTATTENDEAYEAQFGTPLDLFAELPAPPISRDMLPRVIADYAFDQADLLGVEPAMIAMPAIVACASVIHDGIEVQPKRHETGWRESARLWCAVVGAPSVRKSPSLKRVLSRLKKINKDLCDENDRKMADYAVEIERFKDAKKDAKKNNEPDPAKPDEPQKKRLIVEDVTVEALSEILKHNDRGVLCVQDELTGWFGSMDAYSGGKGANKDRAHWLEIYNGGHRMVDRVLRGNVSIPNWSACMVGGIQPEMIRQVAKNMGEDGLMQRFMVVIGRNSGAEQDRPENDQARRVYGELIDRLYAIKPSADVVTLSEDAHRVREELTQFAGDLIEYSSLPGGLKSHLGKWSGLFARLLLTYHVIDCCIAGIYPTARPIPGATAERVALLMRRFLLPHAMAYYTDVMGGVGDMEHVRWVAGHILAKKLDVLEHRDLMQAYRVWRSLDQWKRVRIMVALEDYGWILPTSDPRPGRQVPQSWAVNPQVHRMFGEASAAEKAKRAEVHERLKVLMQPTNIDNNGG